MELNGNQVVLKNKNYKKRNRVGKTQPMIGATEKAMDPRLSKFMSNGDLPTFLFDNKVNHTGKKHKLRMYENKADKEFQLKQDKMFWLENKINNCPNLSKAIIKEYKKQLKELMEA